MNRRKGFTLIELLVVIGIIALLIGILLPVLAQARKTGQQIQCLGHVKGIGIALELFADDHRDEYPMAGGHLDWDDTAVRPDGRDLPSWMQQIDYYVAAEKAAFDGCPTYPATTPYHYFLGTRAAWVASGPDGSRYFTPVVRKRIRYPTALILSGDNTYNFADTGDPNMRDADKDDFTQEAASFRPDPNHWEPHHSGGLNLLFADSHGGYFRAFDPVRMTYYYDDMVTWDGSYVLN